VKTTVQVEEWECDACGKTYVMREHAERPYGLHGHVLKIDASGGNTVEWYSCSATVSHIGKAIINAFEREMRQE